MVDRTKIYRFISTILVFFFFVVSMGVPKLYDVEAVVPTQPIPGSTPQVCIGYDAEADKWGQTWQLCPAGYAFYGSDSPSGTCCPLPLKEILTEEHVEAEQECPNDYVATGNRYDYCNADGCKYRLHCTKIDTDRFQLGELKQSVYWGDGFTGWQGSQRVSFKEIPAGIRYAMGRVSRDQWGPDGCVGYPWGSLLSKRTSGYCNGMYFRQLQFAGRTGDPARGTPVQMFPECERVEDIFDPAGARCVSRSN